MAKSTSGKAGASVRRMGWRRFLFLSAAALGIFGVLAALLTSGDKLPPWLFLGGVLVLPAVLDVVMDRGGRRVNQAAQGAEGEEAVARELEKLDDRFHVIHDVIVGPGNIDHVVIGPAGIFIIETKSHHGQVTFENEQLLLSGRPFEKNLLSQSYAEAMALRDHLKKATGKDFFVTPLLVFTSAFVKVRGKAKGVEVLPLKWTNERLQRGREVIDEAERARLARALGVLTDEARRSSSCS